VILSLSNGVFCNQRLDQNLATIKSLGFGNIEFNMKSVKREDDIAVYEAKKIIEMYDLKCVTVHAATLHVKDEIEIHRAIYYGKISIAFAHKLMAPIVTVHSNISKKLSENVRNKCLGEIFSELNKYAKELGVKLSLENLSYTSTGFGKNVYQLEDILKIIDSGDMGITLDLCHALETKQTINLLEKYGKLVCNVHMANKSHKPFTRQTEELRTFLTKLYEYEYQGPVTLELKQKTAVEEILKSKKLFENLLKEYN
jgi:sugar phosphate isomerase/epimerase